MVGFRTKTVTTEPLLAKKEEHSQELCNMNLGFLLPRPYLETIISKSVAREDVPHFLKGQPRKSEGEFIELHSDYFILWSINISSLIFFLRIWKSLQGTHISLIFICGILGGHTVSILSRFELALLSSPKLIYQIAHWCQYFPLGHCCLWYLLNTVLNQLA